MAAVLFDTLRTVDNTGISGTYAAVGTPLTVNWRMFRLTNTTDGNIFVSTDGSTDMLYVPAGSFVLYDLATNVPPVKVSDSFLMAIGTQFYVRSDDSLTVGGVFLEGVYSQVVL